MEQTKKYGFNGTLEQLVSNFPEVDYRLGTLVTDRFGGTRDITLNGDKLGCAKIGRFYTFFNNMGLKLDKNLSLEDQLRSAYDLFSSEGDFIVFEHDEERIRNIGLEDVTHEEYMKDPWNVKNLLARKEEFSSYRINSIEDALDKIKEPKKIGMNGIDVYLSGKEYRVKIRIYEYEKGKLAIVYRQFGLDARKEHAPYHEKPLTYISEPINELPIIWRHINYLRGLGEVTTWATDDKIHGLPKTGYLHVQGNSEKVDCGGVYINFSKLKGGNE